MIVRSRVPLAVTFQLIVVRGYRLNSEKVGAGVSNNWHVAHLGLRRQLTRSQSSGRYDFCNQ